MTKARNGRIRRLEKAAEEGEPSADTELLVRIADGLVECYRDLLGEPLPDRMKGLVQKFATGESDVIMEVQRGSRCY